MELPIDPSHLYHAARTPTPHISTGILHYPKLYFKSNQQLSKKNTFFYNRLFFVIENAVLVIEIVQMLSAFWRCVDDASCARSKLLVVERESASDCSKNRWGNATLDIEGICRVGCDVGKKIWRCNRERERGLSMDTI